MRETGVELAGQTVYIGHGDAKADADFLADVIRKTVPVKATTSA
jgi:hypothetical protein